MRPCGRRNSANRRVFNFKVNDRSGVPLPAKKLGYGFPAVEKCSRARPDPEAKATVFHGAVPRLGNGQGAAGRRKQKLRNTGMHRYDPAKQPAAFCKSLCCGLLMGNRTQDVVRYLFRR